jgi:imidazoleglycerol phosphate dehydratase HisB
MPTEMFYHFFKSFSDTSKCNLNIKCEGHNEHHKIEAIFKGFAKSIKMAVKRNFFGRKYYLFLSLQPKVVSKLILSNMKIL